MKYYETKSALKQQYCKDLSFYFKEVLIYEDGTW